MKRNILICELDSLIFLETRIQKYNYVELFDAKDYLLRAKTFVSLMRSAACNIQFATHGRHFIITYCRIKNTVLEL